MPTNELDSDRIYGLIARFDTPEQILNAANRAREAGYRRMDSYTPFPIADLPEALGMHSSILPWLVLGGGVTGVILGYGMQYFAAVINYPINVGGRPLHSWPAFFPVTFEVGILLAAFAAVFGMLVLNGLPQPYHPVFNAPNFDLASQSHFFLSIQARDPKFDLDRTRQFLHALGASEVSVVEY